MNWNTYKMEEFEENLVTFAGEQNFCLNWEPGTKP